MAELKKPAQRKIAGAALAAETGALLYFTALIISVAVQAAGWPVIIPAAAIAAAGIAAGYLILLHTSHMPLAVVTATWPMGIGGWLIDAHRHGGPWHTGPIAVLTGFCAAGTWALILAISGYHATARDAARAQALALAAAGARVWEDLLRARGYADVKVTGITVKGGIRRVTCLLPADGSVTFDALAGLTRNIAAARRLAADAVYFTKGRHDGEIIMHLIETDVLAEDIPFPDIDELLSAGPLSITRLLPAGVELGGGVFGFRFCEIGWWVVGAPGAGKSNLFDVLIALVAMCEDAIPVLIDHKGGRLAAPWIQPWVDGETDHPVLEWVATDRKETWELLSAVARYLDVSMNSLRGGSKAKPSRDNPQLVIFGDEAPDWLGNMPLAEQGDVKQSALVAKTEQIARKIRSEGVSMVLAQQRGTVTQGGSGDIKAMLRGRIGLGVATEADARLVMPDDALSARLLARLQHPGTMLATWPGRRKPAPVKIYRLDPALDEPHGQHDLERIRQIAIRFGKNGVRPRPSPLMFDGFGPVYEGRWDRSALYKRLAETSVKAQALARSAEEQAEAQVATKLADVHTEAEELLASAGIGRSADKYTAAKARIDAWLAESPALTMGLSVAEMEARLAKEGIQVRKETLHDWMNAKLDAGQVRRIGKKHSPGVRYLRTWD